MSEAKAQARRGLGFLPLLTLIFAAAKVFGFSTMSWVWVFSPLWLVFAALIALWLFGALLLGIAATADHIASRKS